LNGKRVNTIQAIWAANPKQVSDEAYAEFYKYVANANNDYVMKLHLRFDAPLDIKALLFVPATHTERFGMGRMSPGVSLYSRKILIENKSPDILPEWLRFLKGVIDSEDLPVSISREKAQDSALIGKIRKALTRRFLSFLANKAKKDPEDYKTYFYPEYGYFLKEGVCANVDFQEQLCKLLYWETSKTLNKELSSFDEYISRSPPEQKEIYYLCTASREVGFQSPYYEAFQKAGREVIFIYSAIDEFTLQQIHTYEGRNIVSIEKSDIDLGKKKGKDGKSEDGKEEEEDEPKDTSMALSKSEKTEFADWFKSLFPGKVEGVKPTNRLSTSPAMITNHESGAMRRMMKMVDSQDVNFTAEPLPEVEIEFNPEHEIIVRMFRMRRSDPILAKVCAEQVYDNCLVAAGLMDDSRTMLGRLNDLLLVAIKSASGDVAPKASPPTDEVKVEEPKVVEAEILEPESKIEDATKVDFDGKIDSNPEEPDSKKDEQEDTTKVDFDGKVDSNPEEDQDSFINKEEPFTEDELDKYMNMPENEFQEIVDKEINNVQEDGYDQIKEKLERERLMKQQEMIDAAKNTDDEEEVTGDWAKNKSMDQILDELIKKKEAEEKENPDLLKENLDIDTFIRESEEKERKEKEQEKKDKKDE